MALASIPGNLMSIQRIFWIFCGTFFINVTVLPPVFSQTQSTTKISIPATANSKKADEFLATLRPATSVAALESGNDILVTYPDLTPPGLIKINIISTMPNTDGIWIISLHPQPENGTAQFAGITLTPNSPPDVTLALNLTKTQSILIVARANGKYYGLQREIKIGAAPPKSN